MKRLGVLLALLVLFSTLIVGTGVSAVVINDFSKWGITQSYDGSYHYVIFNNITGQLEYLYMNFSMYEGSSWARFVVNSSTWKFGVIYNSGPLQVQYLPAGSASWSTLFSVDAVQGKVYALEIKHVGVGQYNVTLFDSSGVLNSTIYDAGSDMDVSNIYFYQREAITVTYGQDGSITMSSSAGSATLYALEFGNPSVTFHFTDGLTGQPLTGVTVKEGDTVLGTIDDGGTLELTKGTHTLTFSKDGYWSVTKTIDVQGDMSLSVEMYPDSAAFKLENFPTEIKIPENTLYMLTFTLSPIETSATYNTYLSLSGLSNIISVEKDGSAISPEGGKYYLGDISSPVQVSIKFKAGAVGQHGFTLTLTSNDAIMSKTYTTTKSVTYQVEPLPFGVQMPSEWQVGQNELRISESSGQSYLITAVLKDSQGNEVWSDSYAFSLYEAHTFQVNVPAEGSYTLELTWNGQTASYDVTVNPAITLVTRTLTVQEGGEGVITLHFKNPSSSVQYYTIKVSGGFLPSEINQSISVGPLTEKDVSIAFAVPEDLVYDAYELNVQVLQGDSVVFQDKVAVSIGDSGGFTLFGGGTSTSTWAYALLGLLVLGGLVFVLRRR